MARNYIPTVPTREELNSIDGGLMPIINVNLIEGRTVDQKRKLVTEMTQAVVNSLGVKPEDVRIILSDMAKHDYAVAGTLFIDR